MTVSAERVAPGPPLGQDAVRARPCGRVAGAWPGPPEVLVDEDACTLDGAPITDWARVLDRLGEVCGAFALAARVDDALLLARDGVGERTLFYAQVGDGVVFGPSPGAVLASGRVARRVHIPSVAAYLVYAYVPGERTMVEDVREVLPGELLTFRPGRPPERRRLWRLPAEPSGPSDEGALRVRLRAALDEAVRRRLPHGEVGATLSGGIDSSLVVALAARMHSEKIRTWSVSFGDEYRNELPFSNLVARHCDTRHTVLELPAETVVRHLDEAIALLAEPIGDPLTVPNALMFREAARDVGVVLNGEGGDPCFGGPKNLPMLLAALYDGHDMERAYLRSHQRCWDDLEEMLSDDARAALAPLENALYERMADARYPSLVNKLMAMNVRFKGAHHILSKVDALSAPFGVLPRSPLFDRDVVETAFAIPPQLKLRGTVEKYLLKEAVRDLLPAEIVERPKSGMLVPVEGWFSGPLLPMARERLLEGLTPWGLFRREWLQRLLDGRMGGLRPRRGVKIWLLVTLESWLRGVLAAGK